MKGKDIYDKSAYYATNIKPLIDEISKKCQIQRIPMFFTCAVANDAEKTVYEAEAVHAKAERKLHDNHIAALLRSFLNLDKIDITPPDHVMTAARTLQDYMDSLYSRMVEDGVEPELAEDRIALLMRVSAGDQFKFKSSLLGLTDPDDGTGSDDEDDVEVVEED